MQITPGTILVATPDQGSQFDRSVILVTEHHARGTIGIIINHLHDLTVAQAVGTQLAHTDTLYRGGPVNPRALVLLHDNSWYSSNTMQVGEHLAISSDTVMLEKLSEGNVPAHSRLIAGLSGWAPGQLLAEIQGLAPYSAGRSQWLVAGAAESLDTIFGTDGVAQWHAWIDVAARRCVEEYF